MQLLLFLNVIVLSSNCRTVSRILKILNLFDFIIYWVIAYAINKNIFKTHSQIMTLMIN